MMMHSHMEDFCLLKSLKGNEHLVAVQQQSAVIKGCESSVFL